MIVSSPPARLPLWLAESHPPLPWLHAVHFLFCSEAPRSRSLQLPSRPSHTANYSRPCRPSAFWGAWELPLVRPRLAHRTPFAPDRGLDGPSSRPPWSAQSCSCLPRPMLKLESTITCPECGARTTEMMPTNACQYFYDCRSCGVVLKPLKGHCCVFCSYGDTKCPPIQQGESCC
jgi:hypothetical protein